MDKEYIESIRMQLNALPMQSVHLDEMDKYALLSRFDTKFIIYPEEILRLLTELKEKYGVLVVQNEKLQNYDSFYYDDLRLQSYTDHLRRKRTRYKIRKRSYVGSELHYLEIKQKDNTGKTRKFRKQIHLYQTGLDSDEMQFLKKKGYDDSGLSPKIRVRFYRLTLISFENEERVTVDFGLNYSLNDKHLGLPWLALVEIKQADKNKTSAIHDALKSKHFRPEAFSKYCLGLSILDPDLKSNMYKEKILKINKMRSAYGVLSNSHVR